MGKYSWCRKILFTNIKSILKSHLSQLHHIIQPKVNKSHQQTYAFIYVHMAPEQSMFEFVQTIKNIKNVSFSKFQLAVSHSPPPALASIGSRNTAQPQTRLSDLLFKGDRLPVQGLQCECFPGDLCDGRDHSHWSGGFKVCSIRYQACSCIAAQSQDIGTGTQASCLHLHSALGKKHS